MKTLYFEKISQFDRRAEPVTVSIPFAAGALSDAKQFVIQDQDATLPSQNRVLATWEDGSIKWLLVHFQPNLPGNSDKYFHFDILQSPSELSATQEVSLTETESGIRVDTGPLSFTVPTEGFWPITDFVFQGQSLWTQRPFSGFVLGYDNQTVTSAAGAVELTVEESGPLRAVIIVKGKHRQATNNGDDGYLDFQGRITAYAGKPYIEVEHQFIHAEAAPELTLKSLQLQFSLPPAAAPERALGQGFYRTTIEQNETDDHDLSMALTAETMLYQANEHFVDSFYGDFWVDWRDGQAGLTLSIYQAHQHFPKKLQVNQAGIVCGLFPEDEEPVRVLQGMGKTHRLQLHFHGADLPLEEASTRSLQFQLPDRPALTRAWLRENNPWIEKFFPETLPSRLVTFFNSLHDGRPAALGMLHFGDAPDANYTDQGRGGGETVWVNNEYDRPHCCTLFYGLTGQRRVLDSGIVGARHWLDVDFCHYHPDPLIDGGLRIHTRYHATGRAIPSHQWIEGFLDYYFLTGRVEGLEAARSVGDNIIRHLSRPEMQQPGAMAIREGGWALRAMVGMWLGTGEEKWRQEARRLIDLFLTWADTYNGLLAPYTSHSMPRVTFMISLTVNSMARYLLVEDDSDVKALIVRTVDDLLAHCLGPDGIFYYKELPSLRRTAPTAHVLEALTYAYRITGKEDYLKVAARQFALLASQSIGGGGGRKYVDGSGAVIRGQSGGRIFADKYTSILLFAGEAAPLGLLDWYEYPFSNI